MTREPLQILEIDLDQCSLTYGNSPCTASGAAGSECYNTFQTCQDQPNYDRTTTTYRFSRNQRLGATGNGVIIWPALQSISTNPTLIALSDVDENLGSLGRRARVQITLQDFRWTDQQTDPYVNTRTYDPNTQGTFFGRLRARNPYYAGRSLRVKTGYVGDSLASMRSREYVVTEWSGPDANGLVQITAQDPLKLADEEFAQVPVANTGKLAADIDATFEGDVDLTPAGIGDSEYSASGRIALGSEILRFTRSGDTLTITGRGLDGTDSQSHSEGDAVQECYRVEGATIDTVLDDLLQTYAGFSSSQVDTSGFATEVSRWFSTVLLTRTIATPTAVREVIADILNLGLVLWWDEIDSIVRLRTNRPPDIDETFTTISDDDTFIEGSLSRSDMDRLRYSQIWLFHGVLDYSQSVKEDENYRNLYIARDADAESANEYDQTRVLKIYQPWLGQTGDTQLATICAERLLSRYRDAPVRFGFRADAKDAATLRLAELVEVNSRILQDASGAAETLQAQVIEVEETDPAKTFQVVVESYSFEGRFGFVTENTRGDYGAATDEEKLKGTYLSDGTNNFADGTPPYVMF